MKIYVVNHNTGGYGGKEKTLKSLFRLKDEVRISYYYDRNSFEHFVKDIKNEDIFRRIRPHGGENPFCPKKSKN